MPDMRYLFLVCAACALAATVLFRPSPPLTFPDQIELGEVGSVESASVSVSLHNRNGTSVFVHFEADCSCLSVVPNSLKIEPDSTSKVSITINNSKAVAIDAVRSKASRTLLANYTIDGVSRRKEIDIEAVFLSPFSLVDDVDLRSSPFTELSSEFQLRGSSAIRNVEIRNCPQEFKSAEVKWLREKGECTVQLVARTRAHQRVVEDHLALRVFYGSKGEYVDVELPLRIDAAHLLEFSPDFLVIKRNNVSSQTCIPTLVRGASKDCSLRSFDITGVPAGIKAYCPDNKSVMVELTDYEALDSVHVPELEVEFRLEGRGGVEVTRKKYLPLVVL